MRPAELSKDGTLWTVAAERTMNYRSRQVPLSLLARRIIERLPRIENPTGYVFTVRGRNVISFTKAKVALDAAMANIARAEGKAFKPWRLFVFFSQDLASSRIHEVHLLAHQAGDCLIGVAILRYFFGGEA